MSKLRTVLVDDNKAFVVLARHLLANLPEIEIIGAGYDGYDAVRLAEELHPDLIIMDLLMPAMGGLQATRLIKAQNQPPQIIIASHYDDPRYREHAAEAGAEGFISKNDFEHHIAEFLARMATKTAEGAAHA
jgi:DNA-binding NarL/FixJ family response regulator